MSALPTFWAKLAAAATEGALTTLNVSKIQHTQMRALRHRRRTKRQMQAHIIESTLLLGLGSTILRQLLDCIAQTLKQKPFVPNGYLKGHGLEAKGTRKDTKEARNDQPTGNHQSAVLPARPVIGIPSQPGERERERRASSGSQSTSLELWLTSRLMRASFDSETVVSTKNWSVSVFLTCTTTIRV